MAGTGAEGATNVRIYSDGRSASSRQGVVSSVVALATLTLYIGWMHVLLGLAIASWWSKVPLVLLVLIWSTVLLPAKPVLWKPFNEGWVFRCWRDYFNFSYLFEETLDHDKRYVFVEFPHGVFPLGPLLAGTLCQVIFPNFKIYSIAATSVFSVPRHFTAWIGSVPATTSNFKRVLKKGSVAVIVGGIAEMFMVSPVAENVMLKTRKGFVRVAVEEGIDGGIVPVYHFGNSDVLSFYPQAASKLSRKLRAALGFLAGRFGLPTPRCKPIFMVTGRSIPVKQMSKEDPGFEAEVDRVHGLVIAELQSLYDRHKAEYGERRPLIIH